MSRFSFQCTLPLAYRPPYDWKRMLAFFKTRAIPGVEMVTGGIYRRSIRIEGTTGTIAVSRSNKNNHLELHVSLPDSRPLMMVVERVRHMFDLDANMTAIHDVLSADPLLADSIRRNPGLRLPGAWDPFEVAVRAVVGQQISVKGARTILGRVVAKAGPVFENEGAPQIGVHDGLELKYIFPSAEEIWACDFGRIGMPAKRVKTLKTLAAAVWKNEVSLSGDTTLDDFIENLTRLPGIGNWTAHYIAMRALGEPDAFPATDLGIVKALGQGGARPTERQVLKRAENWRPWRAYAAIYLWHS